MIHVKRTGLKVIKILYTLNLALISPLAHSQEVLTLWSRNFDTAPVDKILVLALKKTEDLFSHVAIEKSMPMEYRQAVEELMRDDSFIDVISAASSTENEEKFLTIGFPVLKGMLGHRVCLIRKNDQERFNGLLTIHDFSLNNVRICQGRDWPDSAILQRNGMPLVTSTNYLTLFNELHNGRCDCFLRGAQEVLQEFKSRQTLFDIESTLRIVYPEPGYFYVNKKSVELAARIELGLLRALDDGSYELMFRELMSDSLKYLDLSNRHTIRLVNPISSDTTKALEKIPELWIDD